MARLQQLRKRIRTAQGTQKLTFAMKLVEASRFRRAQERIERLRPYALKTVEVLGDVAARAGTDSQLHPRLCMPEPRRAWIAVLGSNRGLAGSFNINVCRAAETKWRVLEAAGVEVRFVAFGRKARQYFRHRGADVLEELSAPFEKLGRERSAESGPDHSHSRWHRMLEELTWAEERLRRARRLERPAIPEPSLAATG